MDLAIFVNGNKNNLAATYARRTASIQHTSKLNRRHQALQELASDQLRYIFIKTLANKKSLGIKKTLAYQRLLSNQVASRISYAYRLVRAEMASCTHRYQLSVHQLGSEQVGHSSN